jgi:hypothetical protein
MKQHEKISLLTERHGFSRQNKVATFLKLIVRLRLFKKSPPYFVLPSLLFCPAERKPCIPHFVRDGVPSHFVLDGVPRGRPLG